MTSITCLMAVALAVFTFPVLFLLWLTESKQQKARRWRRAGMTYKAIGERLSISPTTAKRYSIA